METIKVYRVFQDHLNFLLKSFSYHPDDLYYYLGCTPLYGEIRRGGDNTIGDRQREEGKYFFLFPEDALRCSPILLHDVCYTAKVMEYEFPISTVFDNIGTGFYNQHYGCLFFGRVTELIVCKSLIKGERISSEDIDDSLKREAAMKSYSDTLEIYKYDDIWESWGVKDKSEVRELNETRLNTRIGKFVNEKNQLIKSDEITGKVITIINRGRSQRNDFDKNIELFAKKGIVLDYSDEAQKLRTDINWAISARKYEEAKQMIKSIRN